MTESQDKYEKFLGFEPSEYQIRIFDHIKHGCGNAVIKARAGSGKTATIIAAMKLVPKKKKCIFLAFNKSVKDEISKKLAEHQNCTVKTVHSLGYSMLCAHLGRQPDVDEYKYKSYLKCNMQMLSKVDFQKFDTNTLSEYRDNILALLDFSRMNLAQSVREITEVGVKQNLKIMHDEADVVHSLMEWGKANLGTVDYTDMVWLPNELTVNLSSYKYDWIFNDEAQDYSIAYVKLFTKCFKRGSRFVSCGDEFQSINQFAGASDAAFRTMCEYPNTQIFTLPISYRCDVRIIEEANMFVDDIQARPDAGLGLVKSGSSINEIRDGDMVLSRTNAPLYKLYSMLVKDGVPCYIKGNDDLKDKLLSVIKRFDVNNKLSKDLSEDGLFPRLYDDMVNERNRLVEIGLDVVDAINSVTVQSKYDTIVSLLAIASDCDCVDCLVDRIEGIYSDKTGVCLSTIHKAKGLEADNVHILCRSTMPPKHAKTETEIQQERNLMYVAITRPRHKLCYVSEKEFPPIRALSNDGDEVTEFNYIESKICKIYNKNPLNKINEAALAKFRLASATKLVSSHTNDNKKVVESKGSGVINRKSKLLDMLLS